MCCQVPRGLWGECSSEDTERRWSRDPDTVRCVFKRQPLLGFVLDTVVLLIWGRSVSANGDLWFSALVCSMKFSANTLENAATQRFKKLFWVGPQITRLGTDLLAGPWSFVSDHTSEWVLFKCAIWLNRCHSLHPYIRLKCPRVPS